MLPIYIYFAGRQNEDGSYDQYNKDLGFLRSTHYVLAYDNSLNNSLRIRIETYYQRLSNIPVEVESSSYSVLNAGAELNRFFPDRLINEGTGENYGVEFTLENFSAKLISICCLPLCTSQSIKQVTSKHTTLLSMETML